MSGQKRKDKKERQKARKAQARAAGQLQHALALEFAIRMSHIHMLSGDDEVDEDQDERRRKSGQVVALRQPRVREKRPRQALDRVPERNRSKIRAENAKLHDENLLLMQELIKVREERDNAKQAAKEHADHVIAQKDQELLMAKASHDLYVEGQTEKLRQLKAEDAQSRKKLREDQEERIKKLKEEHEADTAQIKAKHADETQLRDTEHKRKLQLRQRLLPTAAKSFQKGK